MKNKDLLQEKTSFKKLSIGMASYTASSILGPIVFFGLIGYIFDRIFDKKPVFLIIGIFIAFIVTNIMIYKKIKKLIKDFEEIDKLNKNKDKN